MGAREAVGVVVLCLLACGGGPDPTPGPAPPLELAAAGPPADAPAAAPCRTEPVYAGEARFYAADGSGACGFPKVPKGQPLLVAAVNAGDWQDAALCGACARVTGPAGDVVVRIVDRCTGCPADGLDLSPEAFARIASTSDGKADVTWSLVACEVPDAVSWHLRDGSHASWMALQLRDARYAVRSVEVAVGGTFRPLDRSKWNEFIGSGLGEGPFRLRATDVHGQVLEDEVRLAGGAHPGAAQFPPCR